MGDYSEKRKKSWKEIDQARDKSERRETPQERQRRDAATRNEMNAYKKELESFFEGGAVPKGMKKEMGSLQAGGIFPLLAGILKAENDDELVAAADALLSAGYEIPPEDGDVIVKLLGHPGEDVQLRALALLNDYLDEGHPCPDGQRTRLKIELISLSAADDDLLDLADEVKGKL